MIAELFSLSNLPAGVRQCAVPCVRSVDMSLVVQSDEGATAAVQAGNTQVSCSSLCNFATDGL